jgi:uncharacterized membrane protein YgcG
MGSEIFLPTAILVLLPVAILIGVLVRLRRKPTSTPRSFSSTNGTSPTPEPTYVSDPTISGDGMVAGLVERAVDESVSVSDSPLQSFADSVSVSFSESGSSFDSSSSSSSSSDSGSSSSSGGE